MTMPTKEAMLEVMATLEGNLDLTQAQLARLWELRYGVSYRAAETQVGRIVNTHELKGYRAPLTARWRFTIEDAKRVLQIDRVKDFMPSAYEVRLRILNEAHKAEMKKTHRRKTFIKACQGQTRLFA